MKITDDIKKKARQGTFSPELLDYLDYLQESLTDPAHIKKVNRKIQKAMRIAEGIDDLGYKDMRYYRTENCREFHRAMNKLTSEAGLRII
jgi:hypothetical protein